MFTCVESRAISTLFPFEMVRGGRFPGLHNGPIALHSLYFYFSFSSLMEAFRVEKSALLLVMN